MTEALREKFEARYEPEPNSGCWIWLGSTRGGDEDYGGLSHGGEHLYAHRVAYELFRGPIPSGYDVDHLCRVRRCVNPAHLEAVTRAQNLRRGAQSALSPYCPKGHLFDAANTFFSKTGHRKRRACSREWSRLLDRRMAPSGRYHGWLCPKCQRVFFAPGRHRRTCV